MVTGDASLQHAPYVPMPGDVLVDLPHTLTTTTRRAFDARARAVLPSPTSPADDPRLVLDARDCAVIDDAGLATLWALRGAAQAVGVDILVVDPKPALASWLGSQHQPPMPLAFRPTDDERATVPNVTKVPNLSAVPNVVPVDDAPPTPGVLPLDDAARVRLARRRRR